MCNSLPWPKKNDLEHTIWQPFGGIVRFFWGGEGIPLKKMDDLWERIDRARVVDENLRKGDVVFLRSEVQRCQPVLGLTVDGCLARRANQQRSHVHVTLMRRQMQRSVANLQYTSTRTKRPTEGDVFYVFSWFLTFYARRIGGRAFSDTAIRPPVCLSLCPSLGCRHAGCLQLSHRRPPEMCGLRTRPRTDVDPPRFLHRTATGVGAYRLAVPGAITCFNSHVK